MPLRREEGCSLSPLAIVIAVIAIQKFRFAISRQIVKPPDPFRGKLHGSSWVRSRIRQNCAFDHLQCQPRLSCFRVFEAAEQYGLAHGQRNKDFSIHAPLIRDSRTMSERKMLWP